MKIFIRNTILAIMATVVLISTSGFAVFSHFCCSEQTVEFSFSNPECNCFAEQHQEKSPVHSCCEITSPPEKENCDAEKCCDTKVILLKLNTQFEVRDIQKKIQYTLIELPKKKELTVSSPDSKSNYIIICNEFPPPLSGRSLHIFLHQLNIPFPSV